MPMVAAATVAAPDRSPYFRFESIFLLPVVFTPTRLSGAMNLPHGALSRMRAAGGLRRHASAEAGQQAHQILPLNAVDADTDDDGAALKQELNADPRIGRQHE